VGLRRLLVTTGGALGMALAVVIVPHAAASGATVACPATVSVPAKVSPRFYPPLTAGDREFRAHGPAITVSAKRQLWNSTTDYLQVVVKMRAEETQSDWTKAEGTQTFILFRAPTGCGIDPKSIPNGDFDSNGYLARTSYANPYQLPAGDATQVNKSFVSKYTVWDDRVGSDVGAYTSVSVTTRAFTVRLTG
jgi:hypothetical protein